MVSPQLWYEEWSIRQGYFQNFITRIVGKLGVTFPIVGIRPLKAVHLAQNAVRGNRLPTAGRLWNSSSIPAGSLRSRDWEGVKKLIFTEGERGYWKSFRAVPFYRQLLTMKNLNHSRSLAEPCDLCLSKAAILKLWRHLRLTDSPNFFTPSEGLRINSRYLPFWISQRLILILLHDIFKGWKAKPGFTLIPWPSKGTGWPG